MIVLGLLVIALVTAVVLGYRRLASAVNGHAASGVLLVALGDRWHRLVFDKWTW